MNIPTGYRVRGQKTLALFSFVWRKRDCSLTTEYSFAKYFLFEQIRTIDKQRLKQYMGMMPDNIMARVDKALAISVALKKI